MIFNQFETTERLKIRSQTSATARAEVRVDGFLAVENDLARPRVAPSPWAAAFA